MLPAVEKFRDTPVSEKRLDWDAHCQKLQRRRKLSRHYRLPALKVLLANALKVSAGWSSSLSVWHGAAHTSPFSAELRLSMTMRYLAGESYLDIALIHACTFQRFHPSIDGTLAALNTLPHLDNMHFSRDLASEERQGLGGGLQPDLSRRAHGMSRGALDGLLIPIECPRQAGDFGGQEACYNPLSYYCRKGFYAVNVQAICDAHCRFSYVSIQTPGTTHDSLAFSLCDAYDLLTKSALSATLASLVTRVSVPYGFTATRVQVFHTVRSVFGLVFCPVLASTKPMRALPWRHSARSTRVRSSPLV